ncbi:Uncharacterised protein [Bordetella pertussis]|nr:Uncharacterised protein [Bordetella pertussis]
MAGCHSAVRTTRPSGRLRVADTGAAASGRPSGSRGSTDTWKVSPGRYRLRPA